MGVLGHRRFRWYAGGSLLSLTGTWAQRLALGWLVWELTGSAAWLGALALADAGPLVLLAYIGGAVGDRGRGFGLIVWTLVVCAAAALALAAVSLAGPPRELALAAVLVLTLVNGAATALGQPARMALVPRLVPRADVPAAVAVGSVSFSLARLAGPLAGGVLLAGPGPAAAFAFNALTCGAFLAALGRVRDDRRPLPREPSGREERSPAASSGRAVARALAAAGRDPRLLGPLALTGVAALCLRPYVELLPAIADRLAAGPGGLALLAAAAGAGGLLGGLAMVRRAAAPALWRAGLAATAASAGALLGLGLASSLPLGLACAGVLGLLLAVSGTAAQALVQLECPEHLRGRILGVYLVVQRTGPALGAVAVGFAADATSLGAAIAGAALAGAVATRFAGRSPIHRRSGGTARRRRPVLPLPGSRSRLVLGMARWRPGARNRE